jgi:hypothetical protein
MIPIMTLFCRDPTQTEERLAVTRRFLSDHLRSFPVDAALSHGRKLLIGCFLFLQRLLKD